MYRPNRRAVQLFPDTIFYTGARTVRSCRSNGTLSKQRQILLCFRWLRLGRGAWAVQAPSVFLYPL